MASFSTTAIAGGHKDLIHDVAYDWYGTRMATCSSDQHVKIWDLDEVSTSWFCTATFKAHCGSVWKVTWAHPEFGQVIATCSFDRSAAIWEQVQFGGSLARQSSSGGGGGGSGGCVTNAAAAGGGGGRKQQHSWVKRTSLVDSRTSVTDVKFAPRHMGLMIGTCSADGIIRVYECVDVMNLSEWSLQHEIPCKLPLSCISWNPSVARFHPPMMAVGSDDQRDHNASKMFVFEYHDASRRWLKVETQSGMTDPVHDVAFAPNIGRSYHVLAVVSNQLKIISLKPLAAATASQQMLVAKSRCSSVADEFQALASKYEVRLAGAYNDHNSTVWRACWNVTGTILATSGDDGQIKLWKANYLDQWKCIATLQGNNHQPEAFPDSVVLDHHHQQQQFGQNNRPCLFGDACQMSV